MKSYIFLKNICGLQAEFTKKKGKSECKPQKLWIST